MRRIAKGGRRYGRDNTVVAGIPSTHKIAIGFNAGTEGKVSPGKLNGFLIYLDTLGSDNRLVIDFDAMARMGYMRENIAAAMKGGFAAPPELLPQTLRFILMGDAVMETVNPWTDKSKPGAEGACWTYPGTYAASYECYNKTGLWCHGDGANAVRKMDDGSKRTIPCIPYGRDEAAPEDYCKYSGPDKPCKLHLRVTVCLYYYPQDQLDGDGQPLPGAKPRLVSPALGYQARFRFDTSSEYCDMGILEILDAAANRVRGRLNGITGTLTFTKRGRRTGKEQGVSKSITGFVVFGLDEHSIRAREMQIASEEGRLFDRQIEAAKVGAPLQITAPVTTHEDAVIEIEPATIKEEAADPFDAPAAETADGLDADYQPTDVTVEPPEIGLVAPGNLPAESPRVAVADATDTQLQDALENYLNRTCGADAKKYQDEINNRAFGDPDGKRDRDRKIIVTIDSTEWFLKGEAGERDKNRRDILRKICQRLEEDGDPNFVIEDEGGAL